MEIAKTVKTEDYSHVEICLKSINDENYFNSFKRNEKFTSILEHTSEIFGREYVQLIVTEFSDLIKLIDWVKVKENDKLGGAVLVNFNELSSFIDLPDYNFSPSTIGYLYKGLSFLKFMASKNKKTINILEIGAGYGGQCKLIKDLAPLFDIKIGDYGLIDLQAVSDLQRKYLTTLNYNNISYYGYEELKDFDIFDKYDVLISVYALGEFDIEVQNFYVNNVLKNIKDFYLIWNTEKVHDFFSNMNITPENPKTGQYNTLILS
jgi:hypothetical protein